MYPSRFQFEMSSEGISSVTYCSAEVALRAHCRRDKGTDAAGKGVGLFVQVIRTYKRIGGFTDLSGFGNIGVFNKVFYLISSMGSARFRQRKSRRKGNWSR